MARLRIEGFGGSRPIVSSRLLPENAAEETANCNLLSGELKGLATPELVARFPGMRAAFRVVDEDTGAEQWITAAGELLDAVRAPIVNDAHQRWYYVAPPDPPKYTTFVRLRDGLPPYLLGIPRPATAPTLGVTGGVASTDETRVYAYTFVSSFGEEGQLSPTQLFSGKPDGTWQLTAMDTTVPDADERAIVSKRIYRTVTGQASTSYFPVATIPLGQATYDDTVPGSIVATADPFAGLEWAEPPAGIEGLVSLANGIIAAWKGDTVYFSEPYRPWAWPASYALSVEGKVVGIGSIGSTAVVVTDSKPHFISGTHPAVMSLMKWDAVLPCLSRRSVASGSDGVYYAGEQGIVVASPGGITVLSRGLIDRQAWRRDYAPESLLLLRHEGQLLGISRLKSFLLSGDERVGWNGVAGVERVVSGRNDLYSGAAELMTDTGSVYRFDPAGGGSTIWRWKSKVWSLPKPINLGCGLVQMVDGAAPADPDTTWPGQQTLLQDLPAGHKVRLRLWADRRLVHDEFYEATRQFRLPAGFKARDWQFELVGRVPVWAVEVATTPKELSHV